ncbi:hypothetical protein GXW82_27270 [Streptacidiphilus sp. 4-A2]|nr:hypothetical protein [Streptacidiphilus sp. 4-A2]
MAEAVAVGSPVPGWVADPDGAGLPGALGAAGPDGSAGPEGATGSAGALGVPLALSESGGVALPVAAPLPPSGSGSAVAFGRPRAPRPPRPPR